jgi:hypothetical protein
VVLFNTGGELLPVPLEQVMKWTADQKSECGRFRCVQSSRTRYWTLIDRQERREEVFRYLRDAKAKARLLANQTHSTEGTR